MLDEWRQDGYERDSLELWVVGHTIYDSEDVEKFAGDSEMSIFLDRPSLEESVWELFYADKSDVFLIDREGEASYWGNLDDNSITDDENREQLNSSVRSFL